MTALVLGFALALAPVWVVLRIAEPGTSARVWGWLTFTVPK